MFLIEGQADLLARTRGEIRIARQDRQHRTPALEAHLHDRLVPEMLDDVDRAAE